MWGGHSALSISYSLALAMLLQVIVNLDRLDMKIIMLILYTLSRTYSYTDRMLEQPMIGQVNWSGQGRNHAGLRHCPPGYSICCDQMANRGYSIPNIQNIQVWKQSGKHRIGHFHSLPVTQLPILCCFSLHYQALLYQGF